MSLHKLAVGFEKFFAGPALPLAARTLVVVSALVVAPAIHAECLPSAANGQTAPFYMSTHNDATHAVSYTMGTLSYAATLFAPGTFSGDDFPQLFSDRFVPCKGCLVGTQPFDVGQADKIGLSITRTLPGIGQPSEISILLTLQSWGNKKYALTGTCDATTNLLYGSFDHNTMAVISFGEPTTPAAPPR